MRVAVLMSAYNGERFIDEQIRSILDQLPHDGQLLVRDDGSIDGTVARVAAHADPRIRLIRGSNVGFARSFLILLASAPADAECMMLADQDDIWLPDKIARACESLHGRKGPTLYFSRLHLVDERLRPLGETARWPRGPSFGNALAENIVTGCTIALNRPALSLVLHGTDGADIRFHDWWIYLVISAFGEVVADANPTVLYRQHGHNVIGRGAGWRRYLLNLRYVRRSSWVHVMFTQIRSFHEAHGEALSAHQRQLLERYFNPARPASVRRLLITPLRFRQTLIDEILLRLMLTWEMAAGRGLLPAQQCSTADAETAPREVTHAAQDGRQLRASSPFEQQHAQRERRDVQKPFK
jgi:glycosyltransferase involved in cell wall biosynthesis